MRAALLAPLLAVTLLGCAEPRPPIVGAALPPPAPAGPPAEDARFVVTADGRGCESRARVEARLLRAAARRTLLEGYERFRILNSDVETDATIAYGRPRLSTGVGFGFGVGDRASVGWRVGAPLGHFGRYGPLYGAPRAVCVGRSARMEIEALSANAVAAGPDVRRAEDALIEANGALGGR